MLGELKEWEKGQSICNPQQKLASDRKLLRKVARGRIKLVLVNYNGAIALGFFPSVIRSHFGVIQLLILICHLAVIGLYT